MEAIEDNNAGEEAINPDVRMDVDPNVNPDVDPNAPEGLDVLGDVAKDVLQDVVAKVNYLVDNIGDVVADDNDNVNTGEDVPPAAMDGVLVVPIEHATKDVEQSTRELTDPYSIPVKEIKEGEQVLHFLPHKCQLHKRYYTHCPILSKALTLQPMSALMFSFSHLCHIQRI